MITIVSMIISIAGTCIGFYLGYKLSPKKEEDKKTVYKKMKPIEKIKKTREMEELEEDIKKQMDTYSDILDNINNYDGTGNNQKEIK